MKPITTQNIRKTTPRHLGRRTQEEQVALAAQRKIHVPRNLRIMLSAELDEEDVEKALKIFKFWLMDIEHSFRMKNELDSQDVISRTTELVRQ